MIHLMFDLETLGFSHNSVILSIACVPFAFEEPTNFKALLNSRY